MSEITDEVLATFDGWAVNASSRAASRYENFPFHSMARLGDTYYGTSDEGLFVLGGETDDGADIHAMLLTGKTDFGSEQIKSVTQTSISVSSEQPILFSVIYNVAGVETMATYRINQGYAGIERAARVKVGRGAKSKYWQFMLENTNGGELEPDRIDFDVARLSRRVR